MSRHRRSISVRSDTYQGAVLLAVDRGVSLSALVEEYLRSLAGLPPVAGVRAGERALVTQRGPRVPVATATETLTCDHCGAKFERRVGRSGGIGATAGVVGVSFTFCSQGCSIRAGFKLGRDKLAAERRQAQRDRGQVPAPTRRDVMAGSTRAARALATRRATSNPGPGPQEGRDVPPPPRVRVPVAVEDTRRGDWRGVRF